MAEEERKARYYTRVYAINRNIEYGRSVEVIATDMKSAIKRAVLVGWGGRPEDAQVTVDRVEDLA